MEAVVASSAKEPLVREYTVRLMAGLPNNALALQVERVITFVKQNVTYIRDPADSEYLVSPVRMLQGWLGVGYMAGDCDDHVILMNSMLGSIGIATKCVGVKFGGSTEFNHVISGIYCCGGFRLVDPCAKGVAQPVYNDTLIV